MTARRDHFMPQNMDNREQFNVFLRRMIDFIDGISNYCKALIAIYPELPSWLPSGTAYIISSLQ